MILEQFFKKQPIKEERSLDHSTSSKVIVYNNGKILLLRRSGDISAGGGNWDIPGGGQEKDETLIDCARRETYEESGLKNLQNLKPYKTVKYIVPERGINSVMHLFTANSPSNDVQLKPATWEGSDGHPEHTEYKWIDSLADFDNLPMIKPLKDAIRPLIIRNLCENYFLRY